MVPNRAAVFTLNGAPKKVGSPFCENSLGVPLFLLQVMGKLWRALKKSQLRLWEATIFSHPSPSTSAKHKLLTDAWQEHLSATPLEVHSLRNLEQDVFSVGYQAVE